MGENDEKLKENENLMTIEPAEVVKNEDSNEFKLASKAAVIQVICL